MRWSLKSIQTLQERLILMVSCSSNAWRSPQSDLAITLENYSLWFSIALAFGLRTLIYITGTLALQFVWINWKWLEYILGFWCKMQQVQKIILNYWIHKRRAIHHEAQPKKLPQCAKCGKCSECCVSKTILASVLVIWLPARKKNCIVCSVLYVVRRKTTNAAFRVIELLGNLNLIKCGKIPDVGLP